MLVSRFRHGIAKFVFCFILAIVATTEGGSFVKSEVKGRSDRYFDFRLNRLAFGSCNKHDRNQPLWRRIMSLKPDVWVWLGDAVYGDTRILSYIWIPSSLPDMKEKYDKQKLHPQYKEFLDSKIPIIGTWDDHDYGTDYGGKFFKYRLQSQVLYLDFLDEPIDSPRRQRRGMYSSYTFGKENKIAKVILLDTRSHKDTGSHCDMLGDEQWQWFEEQLADPEPQLFIIGSGMQILSDIPFIDKWMSCKFSLDRLLWRVQQRSRVFFISGDVHFAEMNCLNVSGTGFPVYELTSSGMTHTCSFPPPKSFCDWSLKNVIASCYRISNVITVNNFGVIDINWDKVPAIEWLKRKITYSQSMTFKVHGEEGPLSKLNVTFDDLRRRRQPAVCPPAIEQPNWYWKRVFWSWVAVSAASGILLSLWTLYALSRWFFRGIFKDLQNGMRNGIAHLRIKKKKKEKKTKDS